VGQLTSHEISIEPLGRKVECRSDQPILDACLRAGIWLPHGCTHGTCGTCKATILQGKVDHGASSAFALMDFEREEGKALLCSAMPLSDVVVEADVEVEEGISFHPVSDYVGEVTLIEDCARETRRLLVHLDHELEFLSGQYVSLEVPRTDVTPRSFSMANPPGPTKQIELHVRRTPGGAATDGWIFKDLELGDRVTLSGPFGRFFFREQRTDPAIMIAGGTGLAPFKSMVTDVLDQGLDRKMTLYHGARTREDLYDVDYFTELATAHDNFVYKPCLSDEAWDGSCGLVTDVVAQDYERCAGHVAYLCGPPPMVDAALRILMQRRLFPRDIYREDFYSEADKAQGAIRSPLLGRH
jgi:phenol hydroxylase P5 protein